MHRSRGACDRRDDGAEQHGTIVAEQYTEGDAERSAPAGQFRHSAAEQYAIAISASHVELIPEHDGQLAPGELVGNGSADHGNRLPATGARRDRQRGGARRSVRKLRHGRHVGSRWQRNADRDLR